MKSKGQTFYDGVLDIPAGTSGDVAILHRTIPAGEVIESGNMRTAIYGQKSTSMTFDHDTRWHSLEEGSGVWMTDLPIEQRQCDALVTGAHGTVLVGGLGLGYAVVALAQKPRVKRIVVIEQSQDVIDLVWPWTQRAVFGLGETYARRLARGTLRLEVIRADLFDYLKSLPREPIDVTAMGDATMQTGWRQSFDWGHYDIWASDGEHTFHEVVVPLRALSQHRVGHVVCWNEDIMRGQLLQGIHSRLMLLKVAESPYSGDARIAQILSAGMTLKELAAPVGNPYHDWSVPFWQWMLDIEPDEARVRQTAWMYAKVYGHPDAAVDLVLQP